MVGGPGCGQPALLPCGPQGPHHLCWKPLPGPKPQEGETSATKPAGWGPPGGLCACRSRPEARGTLSVALKCWGILPALRASAWDAPGGGTPRAHKQNTSAHSEERASKSTYSLGALKLRCGARVSPEDHPPPAA